RCHSRIGVAAPSGATPAGARPPGHRLYRSRQSQARLAHRLSATGRGPHPGTPRSVPPVTHDHFIVASAGHVDHGKSALVKALTGIDPDRLPEEKSRGITIDLGFAHLDLASPRSANSSFRIGIVDVPGHEDFVKTMVAGVSSLDAALLVVAADDGWMPQTEE